MKLSKHVIYVVCAYVQPVAGTSGSLVSCRRIAGDGTVPQRYLWEILCDPATQAAVRSIRGSRGGGFKLLSKPQESLLREPVGAAEGPLLAELPEDGGWMPSAEMITGSGR